jgi:hypothetical protein
VLIPSRGQRIVVPEQLVCAVHEIDFQGAAPTQAYRTVIVYINQRTQPGATDPPFIPSSN